MEMTWHKVTDQRNHLIKVWSEQVLPTEQKTS